MDGFEPDFENLRNMLLCRDRKHVPVIELIVDRGYKEKFFKREPRDFKDELDFSLKNYHDFTLIHLGMLKPAATIGKNTEKDGVGCPMMVMMKLSQHQQSQDSPFIIAPLFSVNRGCASYDPILW